MNFTYFHFAEGLNKDDFAQAQVITATFADDMPLFICRGLSPHLLALNQALLHHLSATSLCEVQSLLFGENAQEPSGFFARLASTPPGQEIHLSTAILSGNRRCYANITAFAYLDHLWAEKIIVVSLQNCVRAKEALEVDGMYDMTAADNVMSLPHEHASHAPLCSILALHQGLDFTMDAHVRRFVWRTDKDHCFRDVDLGLVTVIGRATAPKIGQNFITLANEIGIDRALDLAMALERRVTWTNLRLAWPVVGKIAPLILDFSALPAFEGNIFAGFRGFAIFDPSHQVNPKTTDPKTTDNVPSTRVQHEGAIAPPTSGQDIEAANLPYTLMVEDHTAQRTEDSTANTLIAHNDAFKDGQNNAENHADGQEPVTVHADDGQSDYAATEDLAHVHSDFATSKIKGKAGATFAQSNIVSAMPFILKKIKLEAMRLKDEKMSLANEDELADDENLARKYAKKKSVKAPLFTKPASFPSFSDDHYTLVPQEPWPQEPYPSYRQNDLSEEEKHAFAEIAQRLKEAGAVYDAREKNFVSRKDTARHQSHHEARAKAKERRALRANTIRDAAALVADTAVLVDNLPHGLLIQKGETSIYANYAMLEMLGFDTLDAFNDAGGLDRFFEATPSANSQGLPCLTRANGEHMPVHVTMQAVSWDNGPASLFCFSTPVPSLHVQKLEALELELRARQQEARELDAILDTATDGVILLDGTGTILALNRSAEALFGLEQGDVAGKPITDMFAPASHPLIADYLQLLQSGGVASLINDGREVLGLEREGRHIALFMTMGAVAAAPAQKYCAVLRDLTQWKQAEAELKAARQKAEEASAHKSAFLAKISHEVRTPLNAILGFTEVIMEERFGPIGTPRYKDYLQDIHRSGLLVISLVNDLLDLAKIEAGKMELTFAEIDANKIIQECVALMQPQANRERIIMRLSLAPRLPKIKADERSLRQIILNLLSNAIKFNEPGGQVIVSSALSDSGYVIIRVRDTGLGMNEKDLVHAFEPFRQLENSARVDGTGLGLPITKAMVEANQATLLIKSKVHEGTLIEIAFAPSSVLT